MIYLLILFIVYFKLKEKKDIEKFAFKKELKLSFLSQNGFQHIILWVDLTKFNLDLISFAGLYWAFTLLNSAFCQKHLSNLENKQDLSLFLTYLLDSRLEKELVHKLAHTLKLLIPKRLLWHHTNFLWELQDRHIEEFHKM